MIRPTLVYFDATGQGASDGYVPLWLSARPSNAERCTTRSPSGECGGVLARPLDPQVHALGHGRVERRLRVGNALDHRAHFVQGGSPRRVGVELQCVEEVAVDELRQQPAKRVGGVEGSTPATVPPTRKTAPRWFGSGATLSRCRCSRSRRSGSPTRRQYRWPPSDLSRPAKKRCAARFLPDMCLV